MVKLSRKAVQQYWLDRGVRDVRAYEHEAGCIALERLSKREQMAIREEAFARLARAGFKAPPAQEG